MDHFMVVVTALAGAPLIQLLVLMFICVVVWEGLQRDTYKR